MDRTADPGTSDPGTSDPGTVVTTVAAGVSARQHYVDPSPAERAAGGIGLERLLTGDRAGAAELLEPLGFSLADGTDPVSGRPFLLAVSQTDREAPRPWGVYLLDLSAPLGLSVAVPHPRSDARCEQLALRLWREVPGSVLAMAAVHREAVSQSGALADHAHNPDSLFHHLWTAVLGPRGVRQVQLHGFADDTAPEQVAVSTGIAPVSPLAAAIADAIAATGLCTTLGWDGTADEQIRATRNVQGLAAAANGWVWVHIEHNRTVRDSEPLWHPAVDAVASACSAEPDGAGADSWSI